MSKLRVAVIGMGYVGLSTGMALAKHGYKTICTTTTLQKAEDLNKGVTPFYEPGLDEIVRDLVHEQMLSGSTNNIDAVKKSDISFICVGTPSLPDGSADLSAIREAAQDIGKALVEKGDYHVVVAKSTIPPGTTMNLICPVLEEFSGKKVGKDFGLCMSPEFLREGEAVHDSLNPDRIIIGEYNSRSGDLLNEVYSLFFCPKMRCEVSTAEIIKYAANSLLATKISFANEFARICEKFNVDVYEVMRGVGLDFRINPRFLRAGVGFGGSCFPKDVSAISKVAKDNDVETPILDAVLYTNEIQPIHLVDIIDEVMSPLNGKTAAFLGLSFKSDTDDVRYTRALPMIEKLHEKGVKIKAYDPKAIENFKKITDIKIDYVNNIESTLSGSDFIVVQSDWKEIKELNMDTVKKCMKSPTIFDGRRTYDPILLNTKGIKYYGIGWKNTN